MKGIIITHPEMGVYLGNCMGLGFWTRLDCIGQPAAVSFKDKAQAQEHIASWDAENDPEAYGYHEAETDKQGRVTIELLAKAGFEHDAKLMRADIELLAKETQDS